MGCPVCKDESRTCEHVCYTCDKIVEIGTCTDGRCEECCSLYCDGGVRL